MIGLSAPAVSSKGLFMPSLWLFPCQFLRVFDCDLVGPFVDVELRFGEGLVISKIRFHLELCQLAYFRSGAGQLRNCNQSTSQRLEGPDNCLGLSGQNLTTHFR